MNKLNQLNLLLSLVLSLSLPLPLTAQVVTLTASSLNVPQGGSAVITFTLTGATQSVGMQWDVQRSNPALLMGTPVIGPAAASVNKSISYNASRYMLVGVNSTSQGVIPNGVLATQTVTVPASTPVGPATLTVTTPLVQVNSAGTGSTYSAGAVLTLNVTAVVTQIAVPNVTGQTQASATAAIAGAGLTLGTVTTSPSPTVVAGNVISSTPPSGTLVNSGSTVNLVVSTGPVITPPLTGDLNGDGVVNGLDVGIAISQALKITPCTTADLNKDGVCDILDIVMIAKQAP